MNKNTPKRYRLLKDTPDNKAGDVFTLDGDRYYPSPENIPVIEKNSYFKWQVEGNTEWFQEIVEPERNEVLLISKWNVTEWGNAYSIKTTQPIPEDKFPAIRSAIENVLNGTSTLYDCHQEALEEMSKMYSASQLEEAEKIAFKAGREHRIREYGKWEWATFKDWKEKLKSHLINKDTK